MRFFSAAEIDGLLNFPALVDALAEAFRGDIVTPVRHHHEIERPDAAATLLLMPAWTAPEASPAFLGTKVVTVFPGNAAVSLPSVMGSYLLMDGATGAPLAAFDGARLTLWRTAAASALASRMLERPDTKRMLMVGAGALSTFLVRAHRSVRHFEDIAIWARRPEAAAEIVEELARDGIEARVADNLEAEARQADLISCATLSREPLIQGRWLKRTAHLDLVGAFNLSMREADDEALQRAHVFVDTQAALHEGCDVAVAIKAGAYKAEQISGTLAGLCRGEYDAAAERDDVTLFKSVGTALEDLAAAMLVWKLAN
ncbi:ornithine cyclodeaminase family protein [Bosea sp. (in: a-proteobacteria)]|uniref:ornithine cyclodeaminase family protein n=1 Tax=Bosea sp. (in: a-proteobacteria) TaxID=1871050 RepID=UPI0025B8C8FD|nr:ornithine cyclodeaminase family protein [Bosea sp. (in: a-proteobacteria)]MBR3190679.1 ornithine cyclodeaminase family protein [Bosea sp. (in: a-proteobacteria)]